MDIDVEPVKPEPTKAPKPTAVPTPTPVVEEEDEYDKEMYDKFIKAGKDHHKNILNTKVVPDWPELLPSIYAFVYVVNADYIDGPTTKKLVDDGIILMDRLDYYTSNFSDMTFDRTSDQQRANTEITDITELCLNSNDKKTVNQCQML